jgi:hypothetical protein
MPFCPNCTYEYVEGIEKCPDCGISLVDELVDHDWVIVYTSDQEYDIQMMKDAIEALDIETNVLSQKDSNFPVTGDLAIIKLLVKKEDEIAAKKFIEGIKNADTEDEQ